MPYTPEQIAEMEAQVKAARDARTKECGEKIDAILKEYDCKIDAVLNVEQLTKAFATLIMQSPKQITIAPTPPKK